MNLDHALLRDVTDSEGAAALLSDKFNRPFSVDSVHQLVKQGKLRALIFRGGILIERTTANHTRGKDLFFLYADIQKVPQPNRPGRPEAKTAQSTLMKRQTRIS